MNFFFVTVQLDHRHAISFASKWPDSNVTRSEKSPKVVTVQHILY